MHNNNIFGIQFTGLSFGIEAIAMLDGTLLFEEIMLARQVISCYEVLTSIVFRWCWEPNYKNAGTMEIRMKCN